MQRYTVPLEAMTEDGYIKNQGMLASIPYGKYDSRRCGCGWIALYNVMRCIGRYKSPQQVINFLSHYMLLGGKYGTTFKGLQKYLRANGVRYRICLGINSVMRNIPKSSCAIIYYKDGKTVHYAVCVNNGEKGLRFLNAIYGAENDNRTLKQFYGERIFITAALAIYEGK